MTRWKYHWMHTLSGKTGIKETEKEMTPQQFLSCLVWWNADSNWKYWPAIDNTNTFIILQHNLPIGTLL